jgi:carboxyl-terminal processing protease
MNRKNLLLFGLVGFAAFVSGGWLLQRAGDRGGNVYQQARLFENVVAYLSEYYVDSLDEGHLYDLAIDGMLKELKDPYTVFLREQDFDNLTVETTGNYGGLGIRIEASDGWIQVVTPLPETPAERIGVQPGDRIIAVEDSSTHDWSIDKAVSKLRGAAGTPARITIARPGVAAPIPFTIVRERIHVASVEGGMVLPGGVGFVRLTQVSQASAQELHDEITRLRQQGAHSLILDLRYNPGGLLNEGVAVSDLFLDRGEMVVETRGRAPGATGSFPAARPQDWPDMPMVVLVNGYSASAAEIIAGALQDHDRALIVGTTTFGKGLVQSVVPLGSGHEALKLTTGRWFTPSGRQLERPAQHSLLVASSVTSAEVADSAKADSTRRTFHTDDGRLLYGGGGITPDLVVAGDTLTTPEQAFAETLGSHVPDYRAALTAYALQLKGQHAVASEDFTVTPPMRRALVQQMRDRGINLPDSVLNGVGRLLDEQLGDDIARYTFGRQAEISRQVARDPQVRAATSVLARAKTPAELFKLAAQADQSRGR